MAGQVSGAVWALYASLLKKTGPLPSLVEWDTDVPDWAVLKGECDKASAILAQISESRKDTKPVNDASDDIKIEAAE